MEQLIGLKQLLAHELTMDNAAIFEQLAALEAQLFIHDAWAAATIHYWLKSEGNDGLLLVDEANTIVAYCLYNQLFEQAEIIRIGVHPNAQKQGLASRLLDSLVAHLTPTADTLLLEVRTDNSPAIQLYQKLGFTVIHTRKAYYRNQDGSSTDALIMQKPL
jgi:ribosomal-protein-alanine N-acetyltransferase